MPSDYEPILRRPMTVTVAGRRTVVPFRPAAEWAAALDKLYVLAGILAEGEDQGALVDLILDDEQAVADLKRESLRILEEASGRKWWEAARLLNASVQSELLGRLVLSGVDPWARSVGEWCAAVYALCVKGQDEKGRLKFDFSLSIPPPDFEDEWDDGNVDPSVVMSGLAGLRR